MIKTYSKINNKPSSLVDNLAFCPRPDTSYLMIGEMHQEYDTTTDTVESVPSAKLRPTNRISPSSPSNLRKVIIDSADCLLFITYTPFGAITSRWYLVQVDFEATTSDLMSDLVEGEYYCTFLAKHPSDVKSSDDCSWYWPNWYRYSRDLVNNEIVFGDSVFFCPNTTPDHEIYIQWGNRAQLVTGGFLLLGPFDFKSVDKSNRTRNIVPTSLWHQLAEICHRRNILPLTVGGWRQFRSAPRKIIESDRKIKR